MNFRQLETFLMVADELNFSRAAQRLHLAQSSVSAQVRALEKDLGIMLFDRIGKTVHLTDGGKKLYGYARKMKTMTEEIKSEVGREVYRRGSLTIRMPASLASTYMIDVISKYHHEYPGVQLHFINCADRNLARELSAGHIDIALLMTDDTTMKDVNIRFLKTEPLTVCCSPSHPLAKRKSLNINALANELLLLPKTD